MLWLSRTRADSLGTLVRYDAGSPMGLSMLETYADAVRLMKLRSDGDPMSWTWWWYNAFRQRRHDQGRRDQPHLQAR